MPPPTPSPTRPSNARPSPTPPPPLPRAFPNVKPTLPTTLADLSPADLARYRNRRTWIFSIAIFGLVGSSVLIGAGLKEEWQRRQLKKLRELEMRIATGTDTTTVGEGKSSMRQVRGQEMEEEVAANDEANGSAAWRERDTLQRRKRINEQIENLEARRKELVTNRGEIVAKVERLQERMRRREAERGERERMSKEGGRMVRVER